jgi:hypothetical protein
VGIALAAAIAGGLDARQPCIERVLDVALQNARLSQNRMNARKRFPETRNRSGF